jgi:exonuclease III
MSTLSHNCRGLGDPATINEVRDLVRTHHPSILCLLETQIAKTRMEGLAHSLGFDHAYGVGSSGRSEGLCIYWKDPLVLI